MRHIVVSHPFISAEEAAKNADLVTALCNTLGNLSSVYTPYLWPSSHGPRYLPAWMASIGYSAAVILLAWLMKIVLTRKNKQMKRDSPETANFYVY